MILDQFVDDLVGRGVSLWVEGDRLAYEGPPGSMRLVDLEFLRDNKAELIERIASSGGIGPAFEEEEPAWLDDPTLAIRTADVRASVEHYLASRQVEARPARPTDRSRRADPLPTPGPTRTTTPATERPAPDNPTPTTSSQEGP